MLTGPKRKNEGPAEAEKPLTEIVGGGGGAGGGEGGGGVTTGGLAGLPPPPHDAKATTNARHATPRFIRILTAPTFIMIRLMQFCRGVNTVIEPMVFADVRSVVPLLASDAYHRCARKNRVKRKWGAIFG